MRVSDVSELLLLAALWGGSFLFMRMVAPVLGPVWLIEMRVLLAGLALLPLLMRLNLWGEVRRRAIPLFVVGCINSALPFLFLAFASVFLPAGFTSILNATSPLFGTVVAVVWLKENLTISRTIGFVLGFAGVTVLVGWKTFAATPSFFAAVGAGLMAALMYAIAAPYTKRQLYGVPPLVIATISQLSAAVFLLPALPIFDGSRLYSLLSADSKCRLNKSIDGYLSHSSICNNMGGNHPEGANYLTNGVRLWFDSAGNGDR